MDDFKASGPITILIADDDPDDRMLVQDAFAENELAVNFYFVEDGEELLNYLNHRGDYNEKTAPRPDLILLDLNMPRMDGREALEYIKNNDTLKSIPVIVLTTSHEELDIIKSYDLGVNSFITKPVTFNELVDVVKRLGEYWFGIVELPKGDQKE